MHRDALIVVHKNISERNMTNVLNLTAVKNVKFVNLIKHQEYIEVIGRNLVNSWKFKLTANILLTNKKWRD